MLDSRALEGRTATNGRPPAAASVAVASPAASRARVCLADAARDRRERPSRALDSTAARREREHARGLRARSRPGERPIRALLVDDHPVVRAGLEALLRSA